MKTYSLLKQISSKNEVEKYSPFPHWLQLTGFLEVLHVHMRKEKKKKKKDKKGFSLFTVLISEKETFDI